VASLCVKRESNPRLLLGREQYYHYTIDAERIADPRGEPLSGARPEFASPGFDPGTYGLWAHRNSSLLRCIPGTLRQFLTIQGAISLSCDKNRMDFFSVRTTTRRKKNIPNNKVIKKVKICGKTAKVFKGKNGLKAIYKGYDDDDYVVKEYPQTLIEKMAPCPRTKGSCGKKCQKRKTIKKA